MNALLARLNLPYDDGDKGDPAIPDLTNLFLRLHATRPCARKEELLRKARKIAKAKKRIEQKIAKSVRKKALYYRLVISIHETHGDIEDLSHWHVYRSACRAYSTYVTLVSGNTTGNNVRACGTIAVSP